MVARDRSLPDELKKKKAQKESKKKKEKKWSPEISFQQHFGATASVSSVFNYILSHLARKEVWVNMKLVTLYLLGAGLLADPVFSQSFMLHRAFL